YDGYGVIWIDESRRGVKVHRLVYTHTMGQIPRGLTLDHVRTRGCRFRDCWNPLHLEIFTSQENVRLGASFSAQNTAKTHCRRGQELSPATLVRTIRRARR